MSNSLGIQSLLEAEKDASKIVAKAREFRTQRIKDARAEASKEIEELKAKKEAEFKAFQDEHSGDSTASQAELDKETSKHKDTITKAYEANHASVADLLIQRVTEVDTSAHRNFRP